ncbi:MAG: cell division protein FtsW [Ruminococcaceae bacterium]|nr:cell division protein FtsW [Oscillospiraceae bacterium]
MSEDNKNRKNITQNQRKSEASSVKENKIRRTSGVVVTGRGIRRVENLPTERQAERDIRKRREDEEWNRGIVRIKTNADRVLLVMILLLLTLGTIMVFSASYPLALYQTEGRDSLLYIRRQLMFAGIGIVVMAVVSRVPYVWFKRLAPFAYMLGLVLLFLALFIGHGGDGSANEVGVKRWIGIKGTSFNIQPSELMKPALVMMLAWYLDKYRDKVIDRTDRRTYLVNGIVAPFCILGLACAFVIMGKHLSGTLIVGMIGICVIFLGGAHFGYMALTGVVAGGGAIAAYLIANPYALKRITTFTDSNADVLSDNWQTTQGLYAIGSGGLLGTGLGGSNQKFSYVSDAHTDFIFTIWCEEMGFIGAVLLIGLFLVFIWRGLIVALHAPDTFSSLLAAGIVIQVGLQVFLNIGVVTDVIPNTGVPLPFFTYGGSSLVVLMAEMGILLSVSRHSYQRR